MINNLIFYSLAANVLTATPLSRWIPHQPNAKHGHQEEGKKKTKKQTNWLRFSGTESQHIEVPAPFLLLSHLMREQQWSFNLNVKIPAL